MNSIVFDLLKHMCGFTFRVDERKTVTLLSLASAIDSDINTVNSALIELEKKRLIDTWRASQSAHDPFLLALTQSGKHYFENHK